MTINVCTEEIVSYRYSEDMYVSTEHTDTTTNMEEYSTPYILCNSCEKLGTCASSYAEMVRELHVPQ